MYSSQKGNELVEAGSGSINPAGLSSSELSKQRLTPPSEPPPKSTPTKTVIKALPTVRDHTTDQLNLEGDEYIPREYDEAGEKKITTTGHLQDGRNYRCRTFFVPNRGDKLFMLATECARVLGYRDSYLLFNKNRSLYKILATQTEKEDLIRQEILPFSYRSWQIAIVTAKSLFRQFGSRVIVNGRRVRDDYWETKARKQGFTEEDLAGEKRPGAAKARDATATKASATASLTLGHHGDMHLRDYSNIQRPRQEITNPAYQDHTQASPPTELLTQAHQATEYNKQINSQQNRYLDWHWRQPYEAPPSNIAPQPIGTNDGLPSTQALQSPQTSQSSIQQSTTSHQNPQHIIALQTYLQPPLQQNPIAQTPMRGVPLGNMHLDQMGRPSGLSLGAGSLGQGGNPYGFQQNQMWAPSPAQQSPQHFQGYATYGSQPSPHIQQSPHQQPPQLRHWRQPEQMAHKLASTHGMEEIREVVLQHLTSSPVPSLDNQSHQQVEATGAMGPEDPSLTESQRFKAMFSVKWELKQFMKEQFGEVCARPVGSVIALTGSALCAQATTVQEYLKRHWPNTGPVLLETLENALASGISTLSQGDLAIKFLGWTAQQNLLVAGSKDNIVEIAQQLAWLGSVLRTSPSGQVSRSHCQISPRSLMSEHMAFSMEFIVTPLELDEKSCWHELFFNPVIAYNFPIDPRNFGSGLEIPIHMMAALGGASMAVEFNGGIVLKGLSSMFVPIKRNGASIQWHYIRNEDDSRMPYSEVDDRCPGRALVACVGFDSLTTTRAFLGWWGHTTSHLGTADANYHNLDWSSTREPERSIVFRGGSLGFQNIGSGEVNFSPGPKDGKLHISRNGPYQNIVKYASQTPVLLYDTVEKRGWLVPASAVIAHIAQMRHFRERFSINGKLVELVPTDPTMNVYKGAEKMLLENISTKLSCDKLGTEDFSFRDLVLNIWSLLEILMEKDIKMESTREPSVNVKWKPNLRGWEFMDVVAEKSPMCQKETYIQKSHGGWLDFVQDLNALVFFASGFEDIIQPAQDDIAGLCQKWQRVPKNKDYLTASVSILNNLYEEAGSRLTKKHLTSTHLQWHRGPSLFETCPNRTCYDCTCDRLQQIIYKNVLTSGKINPPGLLEERGAAIFGQTQHSSSLTIFSPRQTKSDYIYSQVNAPLLQSECLPKGSVLSSETSGDENYFLSGSEPWTATRTSEPDSKSANGYFDSEPNSLEQDKDGARKRSREDPECLPEPRRRVQRKGFQALPQPVRCKRRPFNNQICPQTGPDNEIPLSDSEIAAENVSRKLRRKRTMDLPRNPPISQSSGTR